MPDKDTKKKDNSKAEGAEEVEMQISQSPDLRKIAEAEMRQPTPLEIAAQYDAAPDKAAFTPEYVPAGVPANLMPGYEATAAEATTVGTGADTVAAAPSTAGGGAAVADTATTTTTVDAPEATPGTTTTTTGKAASK